MCIRDRSIADRPGFLVGLVGGYLATTGSTFVKIGGDVPSGFLGALFAGFVGGFIMLGLEKLCDKMPRALNGIKPVLIYPLAGLGIIAVVMLSLIHIFGRISDDFGRSLRLSERTGVPCCVRYDSRFSRHS